MQMINSIGMLDEEGGDTVSSGGSGGGESAFLSSFMAKATTSATGLLAKATNRVTSMLGKTHKHHATRVVENLVEMKLNSEDDEYLYLDPRVRGDVDVQRLRSTMNRSSARDVIAFFIGGGSYGEYQNLQSNLASSYSSSSSSSSAMPTDTNATDGG